MEGEATVKPDTHRQPSRPDMYLPTTDSASSIGPPSGWRSVTRVIQGKVGQVARHWTRTTYLQPTSILHHTPPPHVHMYLLYGLRGLVVSTQLRTRPGLRAGRGS